MIEAILDENPSALNGVFVIRASSWDLFKWQFAVVARQVEAAKEPSDLPILGSTSYGSGKDPGCSYYCAYRFADEIRIKELRRQADELEAKLREKREKR